MTNDPVKAVDPEAFADALVELTAPDGRVFKFRFGAVIPYAGQDYVVLLELEEDEEQQEKPDQPEQEDKLLITRLLESPEGDLSFEVVQEEDVVEAVFQKYMTQLVQGALDGEDEPCGCGCCGHDHDHEGHDCDCGH
jgi:hypothetical protein